MDEDGMKLKKKIVEKSILFHNIEPSIFRCPIGRAICRSHFCENQREAKKLSVHLFNDQLIF